jgi:hypothetical protein
MLSANVDRPCDQPNSSGFENVIGTLDGIPNFFSFEVPPDATSEHDFILKEY